MTNNTSIFKNTMLHGLTIVYDRYTGIKKNVLNFKYTNLDGSCIVTEFDRILNTHYKFGYLEGSQMVFSKNNEFQFVGNYKGGLVDKQTT